MGGSYFRCFEACTGSVRNLFNGVVSAATTRELSRAAASPAVPWCCARHWRLRRGR